MTIGGVSKIRISALGQYEGYNAPVYDGTKRHSIYYTVSDGTRIALDYYIPTRGGVETSEPLPVIFHYTPYGRLAYGREIMRDFPVGDALDPDQLCFDDWGIEGLMELSRFGYVIAVAAVRGTDASFGARITTNSRREAEDGREIIEWLVRQPFCTGKLGTAGYSYTGATQLECLSTGTKAIAASFVCMTDWDKYDGWIRGGIPRAFGTKPDVEYGETAEEIEGTIERIAAVTVPVDGDEDRTLLRKAIREHMNSGDQVAIMRDLNWRDSVLETTGKRHWKEISISSYQDGVNASGAAVYFVGGVYDVFRRETITMFRNVTLPKKLLLGPWYHMDQKADVRWDTEMLRWFDYWLKGIDNGIADEPRVTFRVAQFSFDRHATLGAGTGWYREEADWPVQAGRRTTVFLRPNEYLTPSAYDNGSLSSACPEQRTAIPYRAEYGCATSVESVLTVEGEKKAVKDLIALPCSEMADDSAEKGLDQIGLTFTSAPLERDLEIIGHPIAWLSFSLEDPGWMEANFDADFFVNLCDVNPDTDEAFLVTSGQIRASLRRENDDCPYDTAGLPWHRCNIGDNEYLELGKIYSLKIDLLPTAYRLPQGHCLRITLANSMRNLYYFGKQPYEADPNCPRPRFQIYVGGADASRIELPNIYE